MEMLVGSDTPSANNSSSIQIQSLLTRTSLFLVVGFVGEPWNWDLAVRSGLGTGWLMMFGVAFAKPLTGPRDDRAATGPADITRWQRFGFTTRACPLPST